MKAMVTEMRMEVEGWATEAAMAMAEKVQTPREETVAGIVEMVGMVVTKWGVIVAHVESFVRECLRTCVSLPSLMDIYYAAM